VRDLLQVLLLVVLICCAVATPLSAAARPNSPCAQGAVVYRATAAFYDSYPWAWTKTMN